MQTVAFAVPILPGKLKATKQLGRMLDHDRRDEAIAIRRKAGIDRELAFIHYTPMGEFTIIVWDTADVGKAFEVVGKDRSDFGVWFSDQLQELHGMDLSAPLSEMPHLETVLDWHSSRYTFDKLEGTALLYPLADGKLDSARRWVETMLPGGRSHDEFVRTRKLLGIERQLFCIQSTPDQDVVIMFGEGSANWFRNAFPTIATSDDPFFKMWRKNVNEFGAVPLLVDSTPPKIEQIGHLTVQVPAHV